MSNFMFLIQIMLINSVISVIKPLTFLLKAGTRECFYDDLNKINFPTDKIKKYYRVLQTGKEKYADFWHTLAKITHLLALAQGSVARPLHQGCQETLAHAGASSLKRCSRDSASP